MPFNLKSARNTFVTAVQTILHPIPEFSDSYVDDLSTFSDNFDGHLCHLKQFFTVIRSYGLTLNLRKCSFAKQYVQYYLVLLLTAVSQILQPTLSSQKGYLVASCCKICLKYEYTYVRSKL